ncbi:hypothetical protein CXB51_000721 [Gossypium anomalum]|uniref:Replication protein A C-terminal domain-containing protein n=1 Tax=Gossypium anomalum TaxID=47600 RepID=A0A8J6DCY3_9ROSI|nr:hypothetical protein CXB51_000721 [Gossypium anomalum]
MTTQPQVENSNFGNPTKGYGYQTNLTNQFLGQYSTVGEQICGVSSRVLQYSLQPTCLILSLYTFKSWVNRVPSNVVARELNVPYDKIRKSLKFIVSEGLLYTTIDDHYKFTDV